MILANFAAYGLNKHKNFLPYTKYNGDLTELSANEMWIPADELDDNMVELLTEQTDGWSAVFCLNLSGHYVAYIYCEGNIEAIESTNDEMFAMLDAEYNLCEYGLLIEIAPELWKIVGE